MALVDLLNGIKPATDAEAKLYAVVYRLAEMLDVGADGTVSVTGNMYTPQIDIPYAATVTLDFSTGCAFKIGTLTNNITIANPTNLKNGSSGFIFFQQDGTGNRTASFGNNFKRKNDDSYTLSTAAGAIDIFTWIVVGGVVYIAKAANWV